MSIKKSVISKISIFSPVYETENLIVRFVNEIENILSQLSLDFEIIFVEDNYLDSLGKSLMNLQK